MSKRWSVSLFVHFRGWWLSLCVFHINLLLPVKACDSHLYMQLASVLIFFPNSTHCSKYGQWPHLLCPVCFMVRTLVLYVGTMMDVCEVLLHLEDELFSSEYHENSHSSQGKTEVLGTKIMQLKYGRHQTSQSVYGWPYHLTEINPGTEGPGEHRRESLQAELILNATRPHRQQGRIFCVLNCEWESWEWAISVCDCHWSRHYTITNTHNNRCTYTSDDENREEHKGKQSVTYWLHSKAQYEWMQSGANLSQHWHHQNHCLVHYTITWL